jgi:hypothetical protein
MILSYGRNGTRDSSVCIATGYRLDSRGSIPGGGGGARHFFLFHSVQTGSRAHPASNPMGTQRFFSWRQSGRGVKLTTHLYPVPMSRMVERYLHSPIRLHGMMINELSTETTSHFL